MTRSPIITSPALIHRLECRTKLLSLLTLTALAACGDGGTTGPVGPPAGLSAVSGDNQVGTVGAAVATPPSVRVRDANGRGVPGVSVKFDVIAGGGAVTGDSVVTNSEGLATVGEWRLGPLPVTNTLRAQTIDHPFQLNLSATAGVGAPSSIQVVTGGASLAAVVGQEVVPRPAVRVRDAFGNPIPNTTVTWVVVAGGGSLIGPNTTTTDADGRAQVGGWRMGPTSGVNQLQARTSNGIVATFNANGIGIPAALQMASPPSQDGFINFAVPKTARVRVIDGFGANIAGLPVVFKLTSGTGSIIGDTVITDANGVAALGDWKLGASGFSQVTATVPGFTGPEAVFTATGVAKAFTIDVRFVNSPPPDLRDAYIAGAMRWMEIIVGDLPNHNLSTAASACVNGITIPALNEIVDDVIIYARIAPNDGPGNILAQAGTCSGGERPGSFLSVLGAMDFDSDDAQRLHVVGQFVDVVTHEMGHVLGMTAGRFSDLGLIIGRGAADPYFTGVQAIAAWPLLGITYSGNLVPLADQGGGGTRDHHWRESVMTTELMTGFINNNPSVPMPLTAVTIGLFADIGYVVDMAAADPFTPALRAPGAATTGRVPIIERLYRNGVPIN